MFEFLIFQCHEQNKMNSLFLKFHHYISYLILVLNNILYAIMSIEIFQSENKVILTVIFMNQVFDCFDR